MWAHRADLPDHSERLRWNNRYAAAARPDFAPPPLAVHTLALPAPDGPVADVACGTSGTALLAAARGRQVTAVDVSDVALRLLDEEAERRGLTTLITLVHADLRSWRPPPDGYAVVLCTGYWDRAVFASATRAVVPGGLLAWEAFTTAARRVRPTLPIAWCLAPGEPACLLPADFTVIDQHDVPGRRPGTRSPDGREQTSAAVPGARRQLIARRRPRVC